MDASARILAPVSALAVLLVATHWTVSGQAEALTPAEKSLECVSGASFDYFPAQFVNQSAEASTDIPTF